MGKRPVLFLKKINLNKCFFIFFLCLFLVTGAIPGFASGDPEKAGKTILEVFDYLRQNHINHPKADELMNGAIWGMIDTLNDPYTAYLTEDDLNQLTDQLDGNYEGVGLYLEAQPDYPRVQEVFAGSPAMEAGIMAGDIIKKVDGSDIKGWPLSTAVEKIKGPEGTEVVLVIGRKGAELTVRLKRAHLNMPTVESKTVGSNTGYIAIKSFGLKTPEQFKAGLNNLLAKNIGGLVIDLRDNTGGYLDAALEIAEIFLDPGTVMVITKNYDGSVVRHLAGKDVKPVRIKTVVLVNSKSASASEILVGALQDNGVATLVGETTYGKGVAQSIVRLKTGGALKLTTTEYTTPKGRKVNDRGIKPDYQVINRELQLPVALGMLEPRQKQVVFTLGKSEVMVGGERILARNAPVIKDNAVYLPLRFTLEAMGYVVDWEQETGSIVARGRNLKLVIPAGSSPLVNGREININSHVFTDEGVSFIPLELVKELEYTVKQTGDRIIIEGV